MTDSNLLRSICLTDIRIHDTRFKITVGEEDLFALTRSIKDIGIICPPTVWPYDGAFIPVSGFRRIRAVQSLSETKRIHCRVMPENTEKVCAMQAVADNAFSRELTPVEQVKAVQLLGRFMDGEEMAGLSLGIFNRQLNPGYISGLLAVSTLPPEAIVLLENGKLALKPARRLTGFDKEFIDVFVKLFSQIRVSSGKQLDIITSFTDVCKKEKMTPDIFFNETGLQTILNRNTMDLGQKGDQVRQYLIRRRFPNLEQARQKVKSHLGRLLSKQAFRFNLPENFESTVYGVSFDFTSLDEFKTRAQTLSSLADHPDLKGILER